MIGIYNLPDPVINEEGHYQSFSDLYGTSTTENDLPTTSSSHDKRKLPFNATQQHVKNVGLLIQCEECEMWRLLFSKSKLSSKCIVEFESFLEDISYTCGATFDEVTMPEELKSVCVRVHKCFDPIEKLYYSSGFPEVICIYCSRTLPSTSNNTDYYPQCLGCCSPKHPPIKRVKRRCK